MAENFSALRTARGAPSLFEQVRTSTQLTPEDQYELTSGASDTQFTKGLRTGAAGLTAGSFAGEALSAEASGDPEWQLSRDRALQTQAQAGMYAPRVSSLRDIGSLEDAGDYVAGTVGQGAMSMAPTLGAALLTRGRGRLGAATSFGGAAGTAYNLERGEAALGQYADPELAQADVAERDFAATTKGAVNAGLEAIVPAGLAGSVLRRPSGSLLGNIGRDALTEGVTEAAQQTVGFGAEQYLDPSRQLDPMDVADAFAAGALTGGGMSAATRTPAAGAQALVDRFARPEEQVPGAAEITPPPDAPPIDLPQLPGPDDGDGGGQGDLFDTLSEQAATVKEHVTGFVDRMTEAAKTAQTPSDFLRTVFAGTAEDAAAADLRPDTEDPSVLNAADPAAALAERDAQRAARAAQFAEELLNDPATTDSVKAQVAGFNGDYSSPEAQAFVARTLVGQRAGARMVNAVGSLIDMAKSTAQDAKDRIFKNNLQDASPAEQAAFNKLVFDSLTDEAKANPTVRQRLPELANAMLAYAARTGDLTKADLNTLSRMQDGLSLFADSERLAAQLTEYAGLPRAEDSFLSRVKRVTNAQQDVRQPNSFLYSSLTDEAKGTLSQPQLQRLARLVDDFALTDMDKKQGDKLLAGLSAAFGSPEAARSVLDYYQQQNRADLRFDPNENLTQKEQAPSATYQFSDPKTLRPYRAFAGQTTTEGGMRRRVREATMAGAALRRGSPGGPSVKPIKMSQYVSETGGDAEAEVKRLAADIKSRIEQHKGRKDEDRTQQINELQGELSLMRQAYKDGGAQAALDLYEVLQVSGQEQNDTVASDEDIAKMATLADAKDAKDTRVTFQREDGSKFTLSAESMWKTQGDKEGSGRGENAQARAKRLFADAAAAVLARPEVKRIVTNLEGVVVDRRLGVQAKRKGDPEYREMVSEALRSAQGSIKMLESTLSTVMEEYLEAVDNEAKSEEYGSRREEIEAIVEQNIQQLGERLDAAREGKGPLAGNTPAQVVARQKLRMYRDAQSQIDAVKFDEEFDARDNDRSGVPGGEERGPLGPNELPRTRMNEELADAGTRYAEEDTGLGVGVERRGQKQSAMGAKKGRPGKLDTQAILDEIRRIRGNKVKVAFEKFSAIGGSGEFSMNKDKTDRLIRIAVNGVNPMGAAWHESLHDFFAMLDETPVHRSIKKDLIDAAEAPHVKRRLRELLAKHPKALAQIEESAEERVAYMYQFWAEGLLRVGPTGTGIFEKLRQFFREAIGLVGAEQRAEDLLTALHEGKFADPSVVAEVLADLPGDRLQNKFERAAPPMAAALTRVFNTAPDRLRKYQNDSLTELADMFSSERGKLGFIQKRFQQQGVWENKLAGILDKTTAQQRRSALDNLQSMKPPTTELEKRLAEFFREMHDYMTDAGVETFDTKTKTWTPVRHVKNYFPRAFDRDAIQKDRAGFSLLLQQHGGVTAKQAENVIDALTHGTGQLELVENEHSLGYTPFAPAVQDRRFTFINPSNAADFAKYQVKDLADITSGYVKQAVHRAEYTRLFGNGGEVITQKIVDSGITDKKELADIGKVVQGLEGSIGNEMSSTTKELMSGVMTLQNLIVLPVAIFSQMVDPVVLAARTGEISDAGKAYVTAVRRLVGKDVDGEELANMLGIISQDSVLEAMGNAYGTVHMSKRMRDINRVFFKYNGMQGWNNSMRIAATAAGERYLIANKGDAKALAELGLVEKDIKVGADGRLDVSSPKVQQAMYRFVDQSVLRPSASNRPVWMSDPRFLLVAHLKQFTYAMHNVVLKRAYRELADGNPKPWTILLLSMPVILAADMAKFALTGGTPPGWGFKDYLVHAVERSGLLGLGDFAVQATRGVETGKVPGEALLGPSFEHLMEILRWAGGDPQTGVQDVIDRTIPGSRFI